MNADCKFCIEEKEERQTGIRNGAFKIEMWKNESQDLDDEFYLNVQYFNQNIYEEDFKIAYCPICGRKLNERNRSEDNELQDRYGIGEEKLGWLQEIGAKELKEPYVYSADYGNYYMSERYLRETPLCKLKEFYESKLVKRME